MTADAPLRGERVLLRSFRPDDTEDVFEYASDPSVTRSAGWEPHRSPFDSMAYIQRCLERPWGPITFAIEHLAHRRVIGVVDIRVIGRFHRTGEIGYTLSRRYWGQGLNVEAGRLLIDYGFERLGLTRIRARCDTSNRRSYRTMEKLGMVREQVLIGVPNYAGRLVDRVVYSIPRREWEHRARGLLKEPYVPAADPAAAM